MTAEELAIGATQTIAWPFDPVERILRSGSRLNQENFDKIHDGMSQKEVREILGEPVDAEGRSFLGLSSGEAVWKDDKNTITVHFHDPQVNVPEQLLVGGNAAGQQLGSSSATPAPYIVQNASNWVYANTGAFNGQSVPNVVGYEIQANNPP